MSTRSDPVGRVAATIAILVAMIVALFWLDPGNFYLWAKAIHIIAVISWMAGMLYLPRLFIYHTQAEVGSPRSETFKIMERRLLRMIVNPAMTVTWAFGLWLAWKEFGFQGTWLHLKFTCVLAISALHGHFSRHVRLFEQDRREKSVRYWRFMNEAPTVLMIATVILAIVKPFR